MVPEKRRICHSEGGLCPRNLLFRFELCKQRIPHFARNDEAAKCSAGFYASVFQSSSRWRGPQFSIFNFLFSIFRPRHLSNLIQVAHVNRNGNIRRVSTVQKMFQADFRRDPADDARLQFMARPARSKTTTAAPASNCVARTPPHTHSADTISDRYPDAQTNPSSSALPIPRLAPSIGRS